MKPVCVPCRRFFRMKQSGFNFVEMMPKPGEHRAKPGNEEPNRWQPYKLWAGDLWECEGCGASILSGFGREPISEHYKPDFVEQVIALGGDQLVVNDC
jgi:hypothetical protein